MLSLFILWTLIIICSGFRLYEAVSTQAGKKRVSTVPAPALSALLLGFAASLLTSLFSTAVYFIISLVGTEWLNRMSEVSLRALGRFVDTSTLNLLLASITCVLVVTFLTAPITARIFTRFLK